MSLFHIPLQVQNRDVSLPTNDHLYNLTCHIGKGKQYRLFHRLIICVFFNFRKKCLRNNVLGVSNPSLSTTTKDLIVNTDSTDTWTTGEMVNHGQLLCANISWVGYFCKKHLLKKSRKFIQNERWVCRYTSLYFCRDGHAWLPPMVYKLSQGIIPKFW